jgi:CheY-like chemotaxis protein
MPTCRTVVQPESGSQDRSIDMQQYARAIESAFDYGVSQINEVPSLDSAPSVLVADDDPAVLELLANYCARMGFDVDTASDGIQAFLKVRRGKPDILVIDVNMPELDGLSVCAHLSDADRVPANVIVITASKNAHTLQRCERVGTYHARKGPNFWTDLEAALMQIDPGMARRNRRR